MKLSFETVVLVFVVTLIHIAAIALISPVQDFEWGDNGETSPEVEQMLEDAISISEDLESEPVEQVQVQPGEPEENSDIAEEEVVEEEAEPVALVDASGFRERVNAPELAEAGQDSPAVKREAQKKPVDRDLGENAQASSSREVRQITPIPRS